MRNPVYLLRLSRVLRLRTLRLLRLRALGFVRLLRVRLPPRFLLRARLLGCPLPLT